MKQYELDRMEAYHYTPTTEHATGMFMILLLTPDGKTFKEVTHRQRNRFEDILPAVESLVTAAMDYKLDNYLIVLYVVNQVEPTLKYSYVETFRKVVDGHRVR